MRRAVALLAVLGAAPATAGAATISPAGVRSPPVSLVAVGPDTFLATAQRRGPVRVFVLTAGAGSLSERRA